MKKSTIKILPILIGFLFFVSCHKSEETVSNYSLGEATYNAPFLWIDEQNEPINTELILTFNDGAKNSQSSATIIFVDEEKKPIQSSELHIKANGKPLENGELHITSETEKIDIEILPQKTLSSGVKSGYVILKDSNNLDRVIDADGDTILKWNFRYTKKMNTLAKWLMWIGIVFSGFIVVWLAFIKRMIFPVFRTMSKTVIFKNAAPVVLRFGGCRKVVLDNTMHKQKLFERIFKGKIRYYKSNAVKKPIEFIPKGRNKGFIRTDSNAYSPSAIIFNKIGGTTTIRDNQTNETITIQ